MFGKLKKILSRKKEIKYIKADIDILKKIENLNKLLNEHNFPVSFFTTKIALPLSALKEINEIKLEATIDYDNDLIFINVVQLLSYLTGLNLKVHMNIDTNAVNEILIDNSEEEIIEY